MEESKRIWGSLDPFYESGPVLGRKVANIKFLHALWREDPFDEYHFFLISHAQMNALKSHAQKMAPELMEAGRIVIRGRWQLADVLSTTDYHCFHLSDCITTQPIMTAMRNRLSRRIFPITGIIHSLSYADFANSFLRHLWPGTTRRDCITCTSTLGMQTVQTFFDWLREGYELSQSSHPEPQLAHIPLAVDASEFTPGEQSDGPVRLLVFGRLSHHSKMDLVPLVRALHRLVQDGMDPQAVELVLAGWTEDDDPYLTMLQGMVANVGVSLSVHSRPSEDEKIELFRSADIFISIADNPQETFGITLVEAGAFGLPTVASEYDGYRDIIKAGETGLLIPTIGPATTPDVDGTASLLFDNQYHLMLAQRTAVSIPDLAEGLRKLIESPELRASMGKAARKRVQDKFAWPTVIAQYVKLWDDLWQEPVDEESIRQLAHPQAMPFGRLFGHYTSETLTDDTLVKAGRTGEAFYRGKDYPNVYGGLHGAIDLEVIKKAVFCARKPIDTRTLIGKIESMLPTVNKAQTENHILWALKHDILEFVKK